MCSEPVSIAGAALEFNGQPVVPESGASVQSVRSAVVDQVQVEITVAVVVRPSRPVALAVVVKTAVLGDVDETVVAVVLVETVGLPVVGHEELEGAVAVVVGPVGTDGGRPGVGRPRHDRGEGAAAVVLCQDVGAAEVGHVGVLVAVAVVVGPGHCVPIAAGIGQARHACRREAAAVVAEDLDRAAATAGRGDDVAVVVAVVVDPGHVTALRRVVEAEVDGLRLERTVTTIAVQLVAPVGVVHQVDVEVSVLVVVEPLDVETLAAVIDAGGLADLDEGAAAVVAEELVVEVRGDVQVQVTVVVVVAPAGAVAGLGERTDLTEAAALVVAVEVQHAGQVRREQVGVAVVVVVAPQGGMALAAVVEAEVVGDVGEGRLGLGHREDLVSGDVGERLRLPGGPADGDIRRRRVAEAESGVERVLCTDAGAGTDFVPARHAIRRHGNDRADAGAVARRAFETHREPVTVLARGVEVEEVEGRVAACDVEIGGPVAIQVAESGRARLHVLGEAEVGRGLDEVAAVVAVEPVRPRCIAHVEVDVAVMVDISPRAADAEAGIVCLRRARDQDEATAVIAQHDVRAAVVRDV